MVQKSIILGKLGMLCVDYDGHGTFSIVDDSWKDLHLVNLSRDDAIRVRDFLSYWLNEEGENECL